VRRGGRLMAIHIFPTSYQLNTVREQLMPGLLMANFPFDMGLQTIYSSSCRRCAGKPGNPPRNGLNHEWPKKIPPR